MEKCAHDKVSAWYSVNNRVFGNQVALDEISWLPRHKLTEDRKQRQKFAPYDGLEALEGPHEDVGGDGRPLGEGGDGHGDEVGHGEVLEALEGPREDVGGDGRPLGKGGD